MTQKKRHRPARFPGLSADVWTARPNKGEVQLPAIKLDIVLKCDSVGTLEAVTALVAKLDIPGVDLDVIHAGVGNVGKSDILMALTGAKLVLGFNVRAMPRLDQVAKEQGVEVRIHRVIYSLVEDLKRIGQSLVPSPNIGEEESILGRAGVIALFKSSQKGIILGCRVMEGVLSLGKRYRIISAMGPVHSGRIESLQIERKSVREAKPGQEVGLKISDFNRVHVGDLVESFEIIPSKKPIPWRPSGNVHHFDV